MQPQNSQHSEHPIPPDYSSLSQIKHGLSAVFTILSLSIQNNTIGKGRNHVILKKIEKKAQFLVSGFVGFKCVKCKYLLVMSYVAPFTDISPVFRICRNGVLSLTVIGILVSGISYRKAWHLPHESMASPTGKGCCLRTQALFKPKSAFTERNN